MRRSLVFFIIAVLVSASFTSVIGITAAAATAAHLKPIALAKKKSASHAATVIPVHRSAQSQGRLAAGQQTGAVIPGFNSFSLPGNDDGSTPAVSLPFSFPFFGKNYTSVYINNNGNLTFGQPLGTYTPSNLAQLTLPMIAPFWADVDTRVGNTVTYGTGQVGGRPAFGVNWPGVGCFDQIDSVTNNFQVLIISEPTGFKIEFNYDSVTWDSGQASGGNGQCLGGVPARAGYSSGKGVSYEIDGSGLSGAFLDSNSYGLIHRGLNSSVNGRYDFLVGNGIPAGAGYVALGDSYSSGKGTSSYYNKSCSQGAAAWPYRLTSLFPSVPRLDTAGFFACSGNTTGVLQKNQIPALQSWVNDNGTPGLVTVTIGGDDLLFPEVLGACYLGGWASSGAACAGTLNGVLAYLLTDAYTNRLAQTYAEIKQVAHTGNVVAVGYPNVMPAPSLGNDISVWNNCNWLGASTPLVLAQFQAIENEMNADEEEAAADAGILFASTANALNSHELCTGQSWINSIGYHSNWAITESGHPNAQGQTAIACAVASDLGYESATTPAQCKGISAAPVRPARARMPRIRPSHRVRAGHRVNQGSLTMQSEAPADGQVGAPYLGFLAADGGTEPYAWSVASGTLPPGLSLDPDTGVISGSPTSAGSYQFGVQATDSSSPALTGTVSVSVSVSDTSPLAMTTSALPGATSGVYYSATPLATGGTGPYTWAVSSGALPAGLQIDPNTGIISGTPTAAGSSSFTLTVTDSSPNGGTTASQPLSITVQSTGSALSITTGSLPGATRGSFYAGQLAAVGGTSPTSWSIISGSLPDGLSLDPATGVIKGVPTGTGTSSFTAQYASGLAPGTQTVTSAFQIQVASAGPVAISAAQPPAATVGVPYNGPQVASGGVGPYTWSVTSGSLPPGLSLDPTQGVISGTPSATGSYPFTVEADDSSTPNAQVATQAETITVAAGAPPPAMSLSDTVVDTYVGSPYTAGVIASSGQTPYTFAVTSGSLPPGISLDPASGDLTGSATTTGSYPFAITATDSTSPAPQTASLSLSIAVAAPQPLAITTASLPDPVMGTPYAQQIGVTGGVGADTFAITSGALPAGLSLDPASGIVSGTPTSQTAAQFTVTVTDSATPTPGSASQAYTLTVQPVAPLSAASAGSTDAVQGAPYQLYLVSTGGKSPIAWTITSGSLPAGLKLSAITGVITGTPAASGSFAVTAQATDSSRPTAQTATVTITLNVAAAAPLTISTTSLGEATQGSAYSDQLGASGGVGSYAWSVASGALPSGLTLNAKAGTISGRPTAAGFFTFTIQAADKAAPQDTATQPYVLPVIPSVLSLGGSLPAMKQGSSYKGALTVSGGVKPFSWSITNGSLPAGLKLSASTGTITGIPTGSGPASFTLQVTDASQPAHQTASQDESLTITPAPPLTVKTTTLPGATQGVAYTATLAAKGGVKHYTWQISAGTLPAGLQLNASTGMISGTPTGSGTSSFTVQVTDSATPTASTATAPLMLTVAASPLSIATALPPATQGLAYAATMPAIGGVSPYSWTISAGSLPPGLSLDTSTGKVTGTAVNAGQYSLTIQVTDGSTPAPQNAQLQMTLTVLPSAVQVLTVALPQATQATKYTASLQAGGGVAPYSWAITSGSLPPGLTLNTATGAITGKPTAAGQSQFTAQVTDGSQPNPQTSAATLQITVTPTAATGPLAIATQPPGATQGQKYSVTLSATGGTAPYTWAVSAGALPPGLTLTATSGQITGTPSQAGTFSLTLQATDSTSPTPQTATYAATITVTANALGALTTALPQAVQGTGYSQPLKAAGGVPGYAWSIASGTLPAGLQLASNGTISGTPTATGTFTLTFNVTDHSKPTPQSATSPSLTLVVTSSS